MRRDSCHPAAKIVGCPRDPAQFGGGDHAVILAARGNEVSTTQSVRIRRSDDDLSFQHDLASLVAVSQLYNSPDGAILTFAFRAMGQPCPLAIYRQQ
jgi:hypothetical protein